jgi:hypothetical protein
MVPWPVLIVTGKSTLTRRFLCPWGISVTGKLLWNNRLLEAEKHERLDYFH